MNNQLQRNEQRIFQRYVCTSIDKNFIISLKSSSKLSKNFSFGRGQIIFYVPNDDNRFVWAVDLDPRAHGHATGW